ncbi:MAG TPA: DUF6056 family protein [Dehalococcoidia bacterium]|nr:DUF6056 family protein [Dehalococcoidia bacterium]
MAHTLPQGSSTPSGIKKLLAQSTSTALSLSVLILGATLVAYASVGFHSRFWADDFCIADRVQAVGLLDAQASWYNDWSGRFSFVFFADLLAMLGSSYLPLLSAVLLGAWVALLTWALVQAGWLAFGRRLLLPSLLLALVVIIGFLDALPNRVQTFYWMSGSVTYTLPLLFFTFYVGLLLGVLRRGTNLRLGILGCGLTAFLAGGFSETYLAWQATVLISAVIAALFIDFENSKRRLLPLLLAGLAGSAVAGLIVGLAPGNEVRQAELPATLPLLDAMARSLSDARPFMFDSLERPETWLAAVVAGIASFTLAPGGTRSRLDPVVTVAAILGLAILCYFLVAATFAPGYYATRFPPPARSHATSILSIIGFAVASGALLGVTARSALATTMAQQVGRRLHSGALVLVLALVSILAIQRLPEQWDERRDAARFAASWDRREQSILSARKAGSDSVELASLEVPGGLSDASADVAGWTNVCIAGYYNVKSVRVR